MKYYIVPGYVYSRVDGDRHWVSGMRLARLYNVDPSDCMFHKENIPDSLIPRGLKILCPDYTGEYDVESVKRFT